LIKYYKQTDILLKKTFKTLGPAGPEETCIHAIWLTS